MKRHRFYVAPKDIHDDIARLSKEESHHLLNVLRLQVGNGVELFDGRGWIYPATVRQGGIRAELRISSRVEAVPRSPMRLILGQSLIKSQRFEWIVEKCTELGMTELIPLKSRYSEDALEKQIRHQRWFRIAVAAVKQSRGARVPVIHPVRPLSGFCSQYSQDRQRPAQSAHPKLRLVLTEKGGLPIRSLCRQELPAEVLILVGPEGGWADGELQIIQESGFQSLHLGAQILRSETAAISIFAILQFLWGDPDKQMI